MDVPFLWPWKLTTEYGEEGSPEFIASVKSDVLLFINAGKIAPNGPTSARIEPLPNGRFGGARYFTTREDAEEMAALDRARAINIPRTIISQTIEQA